MDKKTKWTNRRVFRTVWVTFGIGFIIWMSISVTAQGVDDEIFSSTSLVSVDINDDYISFTPSGPYQKVIFFYPGALVDPNAYAPLGRKLAENGLRALIIRMPWRMATKGYTKIRDLGLLTDSTKQYILAGHSQGGKMAAQFVYENPGMIDRLILLGTTHPRDIDLSDLSIPVLKMYGSNDGVAAPKKVMENRSRLPQAAQYVLLEGANHSQFGYYGSQLGDNKAGITREEQQNLILEHMLAFIEKP